jgi:pimeloyl-ACP methyl ester carboxylesterase
MQVVPDLVRTWYSETFIVAHPEAISQRMAQIATINEDVFIRTYALYNQTEIGPWLERIQVPTLVMTGEFAKGCDAASARMSAALIPTSRLAVVEGARNGLLTETPDRVAAELRSFFDIEAADLV